MINHKQHVWEKQSIMTQLNKTLNIVYIFTASKGSNLYISFTITAAGAVLCGSAKTKKFSRTSSIVQIIYFFRFFEISKNIQSIKLVR